MVSGTVEFTADTYDYYFYSSSPHDNPVNQKGPGHSVRGNAFEMVLPQAGITYRGTSFPLPAWIRDGFSPAGIRCARTDSPSAPSADLIRIRQAILAGSRNEPVVIP